MKRLFLLTTFIYLAFSASCQVDLSSTDSLKTWVEGNSFKTSIQGDFDMFIAIEVLAGVETLVLSNEHGKRKLFTNLTYTAGGSAAMLTCLGEENNSLEIVFSPDGSLSTAGMIFYPIRSHD